MKMLDTEVTGWTIEPHISAKIHSILVDKATGQVGGMGQGKLESSVQNTEKI